MKRILLIGCGFLGKAAADSFFAQGWSVTAVVHSEDSRRALQQEWSERPEGRVFGADIGEEGALGRVEDFVPPDGFDAWIHCASSGGGGAAAYEHTYLRGVRHLGGFLPGVLGIFVSSTSVYGQTDGSLVDETSPTLPERETGRILLEAERETLAVGGCVLRLAGLYGPGRSVLLRKFLRGEARLEAGGYRWINQIHREDAAEALVTVLQKHPHQEDAVRGQIFNTVDDHPLQQRALYAGMAERRQRPLPPEGEPDLNRKRGWTNKRVVNAKLRALGWQPRFPEYFSDWARLCEAEQR